MPMGATLALRVKARGFIRRIDGAKLRSCVPHGHFAPLPGHFVGSTGFYTGRKGGWPEPEEGRALVAACGRQTPPSRQMDGNSIGINASFALN
jgi:hypothetical protein